MKSLSVQEGKTVLPSVNQNFQKKFKKKKLSLTEYVEGIRCADITILSQAITLVESQNKSHQELAKQIVDACIPYAGNSTRIGITGVPGVGKSTFIESFGMKCLDEGKKLAVLAIDPSSERTGGSILGDKTRMETLSVQKNVFIRPSPSIGSLGGVARKTRETMLLCEAAGFDTIIVETVGVGQSETHVHSMVDVFLLLLLAGAGDELQGIKRGIMEMGDILAITKADGSNKDKAVLAQQDVKNALHLFPPTDTGWIPRVLTCSSLHKEGIDELYHSISEFIRHMISKGFFKKKREVQSLQHLEETIKDHLLRDFFTSMKEDISASKMRIVEGKSLSHYEADTLLERYKSLKQSLS